MVWRVGYTPWIPYTQILYPSIPYHLDTLPPTYPTPPGYTHFPWIPYPLNTLPLDILPPAMNMGSEIPNPPERTWDQRNLIPRSHMGQEIPTPQKDMGPEIPYTSVNRLTDTCENITFPQLGLGFIYTRAKAKAKARTLPMGS